MRFEVGAAYVLGVLLPVLETARRWGRIESITSYADDVLIGALLLLAAWSVTRRKPWGNPLLIAAWGVLCGGLYYSFFGQIEQGGSADTSGLANVVVITIKGAIYLVAITALVRSIRSARPGAAPPVSEVVLREATIDDLHRLAALHVRAFNETHADPFGSGPTYATREQQWREKLREADDTHFLLVLEAPNRQLVGFIWCHPTKDDPRWAARLNKIYLLREYQRRGLGSRMVAAAVDRLLKHDLTSMVLFTEPENEPACHFYDRLGGERQLNEHGKFEGMYGWPNLNTLKAHLSSDAAGRRLRPVTSTGPGRESA